MKNTLSIVRASRPIQKLLLIMKLTWILTVFCVLNSMANANGQTITLRMQDAEISKVLTNIEKQGSFRFLYNSRLKDLRQKVNVSFSQADIADVLVTLFSGTQLTYKKLENNLIAIRSENPEEADIRISGKVTGDGGDPLAGASVSVKGTSRGTTTDNNGDFTLTVPENATLVISAVGYNTQELAVGSQAVFSINMARANMKLDEVVVIGYGTQRRKQVTGAISSVSGDQITKQPVLTPVQGLQGLVPGIQVISSGQPGTQPRVQIRGVNTILTNENPLFVVDGVLTDDITNVSSADVVSVDVLKDGAAAIYGSRAANGVVLITTKKGRAGKLNVSFDSYVGFRTMNSKVDLAETQLYATYTNEARAYDAQPPLFKLDTLKYNTDWFKEISRKGLLQNYNVSMSGSTEKVSYFFSAGYFEDKGVIKGADFQRFSVRSSNEFRLTRFLKVGNVLNVNVTKTTNKPNSVFTDAYRIGPSAPVKFPNGTYGFVEGLSLGNPVATLDYTNDYAKGQRFQGNLYGEITILKGLTFRSTWGFDRTNNDQLIYAPVYSYSIFKHLISELTVKEVERFYWVFDNILTFSRTFGDHDISLMAGHTSEKDRGSRSNIRVANVPAQRNLWYITQGDPTTIVIDATNPDLNSAFLLQRRSYFGRVNYSYQDKYNVSGVLRRDGSSAFPANQKWGTFYSVAGSWIISEESFLKDVQAIDFLKLRAGYAELGNDGISRLIDNDLSQLLPVTQTNPYGLPGGLVSGITFDQVKDALATWESTKGVDAGIEFGLLSRRLTGEVSYYNKVTNAYIRVPTPTYVDADGILSKSADVRNKGIELGLNWNEKTGKDFSYRLGFNATFNKNNVDEVRGGIDLKEGGLGNGEVTTSTVKDQPIGSFWVYQVDGIYQTQAEIDGSAHVDGSKPGDFRYSDVNKDGTIDAKDRVFVGSYQPKFYYGISGGISWKQLDFSIDCYGNSGNKVFNGKKAVRFGNENIEAARANRWTPTNTNTSEPRASNSIPKPSTYFVESGSFFRVNNITIGYTLAKSLTDRASIGSARFFITAQNPLIFKKFSGYSPELPGSNALNSGIERDVYPTLSTYMVGVNIDFK